MGRLFDTLQEPLRNEVICKLIAVTRGDTGAAIRNCLYEAYWYRTKVCLDKLRSLFLLTVNRKLDLEDANFPEAEIGEQSFFLTLDYGCVPLVFNLKCDRCGRAVRWWYEYDTTLWLSNNRITEKREFLKELQAVTNTKEGLSAATAWFDKEIDNCNNFTFLGGFSPSADPDLKNGVRIEDEFEDIFYFVHLPSLLANGLLQANTLDKITDATSRLMIKTYEESKGEGSEGDTSGTTG